MESPGTDGAAQRRYDECVRCGEGVLVERLTPDPRSYDSTQVQVAMVCSSCGREPDPPLRFHR